MVSNIIKLAIFSVLFILLLLLSKGFSYSIPSSKPAQSLGKSNLTCLQVESLKECRPCTSHEMKIVKTCLLTGNVEEISCKKPHMNYLDSCPFAAKAEMTRFWVFEACVASLALLSNGIVWWRRNALNITKYQKLKRQISDAV